LPVVQIKLHSCDTVDEGDEDGDKDENERGVHRDGPSPSVSEHRWSSHAVGGAVKPKWTDEDLDAFVRQLSNPQHHVTKLGPIKPATTNVGGTTETGRHSAHVQGKQQYLPGSGGLDSPRKDSFELCQELQDVDIVRAPLARSETDTSVALTCERHARQNQKNTANLSRSGEDVSTSSRTGSGGGLISGLSGLRLIKNKKLARSSHANAKRNATAAAMQKSKDDISTGNQGSSTTASDTVTFSCNGSSPESSDIEATMLTTATAAANQTAVSGKDSVVMSKKRRFRKILSRPLNRSQSAGCAKDVPAHALFLEKQQKKCKDDEM
ncbi:hypothetical protein EGW08_014794, partial [Elysia chlorotica]